MCTTDEKFIKNTKAKEHHHRSSGCEINKYDPVVDDRQYNTGEMRERSGIADKIEMVNETPSTVHIALFLSENLDI